MPDLINQLESVAGLDARKVPEPEEIRGRARRRVTRRRLAVGSTLVVVLAVVAMAAPWSSHDPTLRVNTDRAETTNATTSSSSTSTATSASTRPGELPPGNEPSGLSAVPVVGLDDGELISVTFDDPVEAERATFVAVCDGEVINEAFQSETDTAGLLARCGPAITEVTNPARVVAQQVIETPDGTVDCAANIGRCVVAAVLDTGGARWSPVGFAPATPRPVTIQGVPTSPVKDGARVKISGEGGLPGETVSIGLCLSGAAPDEKGAFACDAVRGAEVRVGDDGLYRADMIFYRDLLTYSPDGSTASQWVPCEPCTLVAVRSNGRGKPATTPVEITAAGAAIRPTVDITEPGPYTPGQLVTLRGTGFQPSASRQPSLEICPADLMTKPLGGDCAGVAGVGTAGIAAPEITSSGTFTLPEFQLPNRALTTTGGLHCDTNGACAIGSPVGEGVAYLLSDPLNLSG